jgi:hypothetical protein
VIYRVVIPFIAAVSFTQTLKMKLSISRDEGRMSLREIEISILKVAHPVYLLIKTINPSPMLSASH